MFYFWEQNNEVAAIACPVITEYRPRVPQRDTMGEQTDVMVDGTFRDIIASHVPLPGRCLRCNDNTLIGVVSIAIRCFASDAVTTVTIAFALQARRC